MRGCLRVGMFMGLVCASGASLAAPGPGPAASRALDKPAFTATPGELLALGKAALADDSSMVILRDQREVSYDDQGRATVRLRRVYVVQTPPGGQDDDDDDDDSLQAEWHPSYQDRPVIRARVIDPAGTSVALDPAQVTELPGPQRAASASGDRRSLHARLPAVPSGGVVEQEIVTTDREPPAGGGVDTTAIGNAVPTSSTVIAYAAPAAARAHHVERNLPAGVRVRHQIANGRETWIWELPALPPNGNVERDVPAETIVSSYVGVATAASWEAVARGYRKRLDQRIAEGPFDLPVELPRAASAEALGAIVAWVHHRVRSSAASFDDAVRTPLPPAETVKQAAGDGNDKATLLVALLRQAGIRADVALIAAGWGPQPDPDLPALRMFDRAIVRARIGASDVWIDPMEELARPGQLPERDRGRRVLVIADDTRALAMTPTPVAADNRVHEVRTFVAAELGLSQLTRTVLRTGAFEIEQRTQSRGLRPDVLKRVLRGESDRLFGGTLDRVAATDPGDLTRPFELTLAVKDARRVGTDLEQIEIYLYPHDTFDRLPWLMTTKPDKPRRSDFAWRIPHVYEIENRIVVPPGFTLPAASPERVRRIGTATFTERREIDGQTLIVAFRLDTGKPRLTPAELAAVQAGLAELGDETVHITLAHTAFALGYAGKPRDAIAECQRLIALHPTEALHHSQLSMVLLRAGAGAAARREARKAVALDPTDVQALVTLGWSLSFDTLGRQYTYDWDRAGAIAALRQARKLDPKHLGAITTLARALQRGPSGRSYDGADLPGAAEAWRAALAIDKADEYALALAQVLVWSGEFAEAEKVARTAKEGKTRDNWIIAAIAAGAGAAPAITAAGVLGGAAGRNELLGVAGGMLVILQRYDAARQLLAESGVLAQVPAAFKATIGKLARQPDLPAVAGDPRSAVFDLFATMLDPQRTSSVFWDADLERELRDQVDRLLPGLPRVPATARWYSDVLQSMISVEIQGEAGIWRASAQSDGQRRQFYLVLDHGVVKVIGATGALSGVGRYLLRGGDARADARARKLLDWIGADNDNPTQTAMLAVKRLWGPAMPSSHDAILLVAAILAGPTDPDRVIAVGARCPSTLPDAELACRELLFDAYRARGRWAEAVAQSEAILARRPDAAAEHIQLHASALARAGRFDDADRVIDEVLAKDPDHHGARLARFDVAAIRGSSAELVQRGDAVVNHPAATPRDLNYVAWYRMALGGDLTSALELCRKAVDKLPRAYGYLNTLAAIEAELGDVDRAIHDNWKAMGVRNAFEPGGEDWYVIGRIYEQLGLTADATAAYKRVPRTRVDPVLSISAMAQRRLSAITAAP